LQVPGYSIVVFALIGAGVAQSYPSEQRRRSEQWRSGEPRGEV
jgi:hypothetical protein